MILMALAVLSGALVGFSLGLVGGGGSILATPLLLYVVGVNEPHIAIGTSALAVSINAYLNFLSYTVPERYVGVAGSNSRSSGVLVPLQDQLLARHSMPTGFYFCSAFSC